MFELAMLTGVTKSGVQPLLIGAKDAVGLAYTFTKEVVVSAHPPSLTMSWRLKNPESCATDGIVIVGLCAFEVEKVTPLGDDQRYASGRDAAAELVLMIEDVISAHSDEGAENWARGCALTTNGIVMLSTQKVSVVTTRRSWYVESGLGTWKRGSL